MYYKIPNVIKLLTCPWIEGGTWKDLRSYVSSTPTFWRARRSCERLRSVRSMASAFFRLPKFIFLLVSWISVKQVTKFSTSFVFRRCVRKMEGLEGCLPFDQKTRLVDRCGNWKASKPEWEFPYGICCSIYSSKRSNPKGLELVRKSEWNAQFPFGNSVWEFWSTFQEIPFSPEIFHLGRLN